MRKRHSFQTAAAWVLAVSLVLIGPFSALAQTETGQIIGKVTDPQGAVVPGATVTIRSVNTGATRTATTNEEGVYTVANLQPGLYEVTINAAGFAANTQRVQVTVGARLSVDTQLTVGGIPGETVTVVAGQGGVEVNTQNQELSDVISSTQLRELPTLTRNPYDLVQLAGTAIDVDPLNIDTERGTGFAINGQRSASTDILLDGGENTDLFTASVAQSVPLDSVQEFRVITSNFSAEYGRATGGIVNVVTRAGSNDFNGTLYEFNRVSALATNDFDNNARGIEKGVFTRNQFGYSVGGRIIRDKLFFFSSTEWIRVRSTENVVNLVPTAQLLAASAGTTQSFFNAFPLRSDASFGRTLTVGEVIESLGGVEAGFDPATNAFAALNQNLPAFQEVFYPVPNDIGAGFPQNTYQTVARVDWNITDRTQLYGRYALEDMDWFAGTNAFSPFAGFDTGITGFNQNYLVNLTHSFSDRLVSQSKLVYNRLNQEQPLGAAPPGPTLYFFSNRAARIQGELVALPGYLPFNPGSAIPFGGPQNLGQAYQDFNWTRGNHQFRFGGSYIYIQDNRTFGAFQNAVETLGGSSDEALSNLVTGQLSQFLAAVDPQGRFPGETITLPVGPPSFTRSNRYHEFAGYIQDNWRWHPNVSLNLGLRYEYFGRQHNKDESLDSNFYFGPGSNIFERIRNGQVFRVEDSPVGALWEPDKNNFAPRVGVAWDVFGDGSTSLRGGYGIAYERNFGNVTFNVIQNPPNYAVIAITAGVDVNSIPITTSNFGPLSGSGISVTLPPTSLRHVREDIGTAYSHFWSAALERRLFGNTVGSIEYSGSAGRDLYTIENINRPGSGAIFLGDPDPTSRLNAQFTGINTRGKSGRSNYNSVTFGLEGANFRDLGLQFTVRYTYGVARDNLSTTFSESSNNFNLGLLDPFNPDLDYGYADFDVRHRLIASWNWALPFWEGSPSRFRQALGGWSLTGIFQARTGLPFTVFDCTNAAFAESPCIRLVPTGPVDFNGSDDPPTALDDPVNRFNYIDLSNQTPGVYVNPVTGTSDFGPFPANMTRRNAFRAPGYWNLDLGIYKNFRITEGTALQFRGEMYNVFNHANLFVRLLETEVNTGYVPAFRTGRRNVQLALKFIF